MYFFPQALLAVRSVPDKPDSLRARPLTWTSPMISELCQQRDNYVGAVKRICGYSEADMFYNRATTEGSRLPGLAHRDLKSRWETKRKQMTQEMVQQHMQMSEEMLNEAKVRTDPLDLAEFENNHYTLMLDPELATEEIENVVLVLWHRFVDQQTRMRRIEVTCTNLLRGVSGILCQPNRSLRINHDKTARRAFRAQRLAYKVWFFRGPFTLPREFHDRTSALAAAYYEVEQCQKVVKTKGKIEIKTCKVCNFTLACESESDVRGWRLHTHKHIMEKRNSLFAVECHCTGLDLTSRTVKYNHYRLHHSGGKYAECAKCGHIDKAQAIANHDCSGQSLICPDCAKVFSNPARLAGHVKNLHTSFDCPECCVTIMGYRKYCRHRMREHDKLRYECEQCDKKFISNGALKSHMMNVHIRSRPYNCRYGCNMAYNDVSNRNAHEKKKHGGLFATYT